MKMQKSKQVRVGKCTSQELFIAMCNVKNKLLNQVVKDRILISVPVIMIHLFQLTEGYIPQAHDRIKAGTGGGYLLKNFPPHDLGHTKASWEAMGITKGRLPSTMTVDPVTGTDTVPIMTMNGVLIDGYSSEYKNRMKNVTLFPSPVMLDTPAVIEEIFKEFVDDHDQAFCQVKGPFYVLDRIQNGSHRFAEHVVF